MILVLSILLGLVPLVGVAGIVMNGMITTVDGLFMSIILLTLSGVLFLNAFLEIRRQFATKNSPQAQKSN